MNLISLCLVLHLIHHYQLAKSPKPKSEMRHDDFDSIDDIQIYEEEYNEDNPDVILSDEDDDGMITFGNNNSDNVSEPITLTLPAAVCTANKLCSPVVSGSYVNTL